MLPSTTAVRPPEAPPEQMRWGLRGAIQAILACTENLIIDGKSYWKIPTQSLWSSALSESNALISILTVDITPPRPISPPPVALARRGLMPERPAIPTRQALRKISDSDRHCHNGRCGIEVDRPDQSDPI